jgi:hypothetical protein
VLENYGLIARNLRDEITNSVSIDARTEVAEDNSSLLVEMLDLKTELESVKKRNTEVSAASVSAPINGQRSNCDLVSSRLFSG